SVVCVGFQKFSVRIGHTHDQALGVVVESIRGVVWVSYCCQKTTSVVCVGCNNSYGILDTRDLVWKIRVRVIECQRSAGGAVACTSRFEASYVSVVWFPFGSAKFLR